MNMLIIADNITDTPCNIMNVGLLVSADPGESLGVPQCLGGGKPRWCSSVISEFLLWKRPVIHQVDRILQ